MQLEYLDDAGEGSRLSTIHHHRIEIEAAIDF